MAYFRLSILLCAILFAPSSYGATTPTNLFILAGQSNMAGRGGVEKSPATRLPVWDKIIPPESKSNASILRLDGQNHWGQASEPLHEGIDVSGKTVGVGPGMAFANEFLAKAGSKAGVVGLVPCAKGGSFISNWTKDSDSGYYNMLVSRINVSDADGGTVRSLFWLQGESDASDIDTAVAYKDKLVAFFTDLRNDIKPRYLPIIVVQIASYDSYIFHERHDLEKLRDAQEAVGREMPDVIVLDSMQFVKPNGEGYNKDLVHLSLQTEVAVGKLLADTYLDNYGSSL